MKWWGQVLGVILSLITFWFVFFFLVGDGVDSTLSLALASMRSCPFTWTFKRHRLDPWETRAQGNNKPPRLPLCFLLLFLSIVFLLCLGIWAHWCNSAITCESFLGYYGWVVTATHNVKKEERIFTTLLLPHRQTEREQGFACHCISIFSVISWCPQVAWFWVPCSTVFDDKPEDSPGLFHQRLASGVFFFLDSITSVPYSEFGFNEDFPNL